MEISYHTQSTITAPTYHANYYEDLMSDPLAIKKIVNNLLVYDPLATSSLSTTEQILDAVFSLNSSSLIIPRVASEKYRCSSREFAILFVSFMRAKEIPARCRVGTINEKMECGLWTVQYYEAGWHSLNPIIHSDEELTIKTAGDSWLFYEKNKEEAKKIRLNHTISGRNALGIALLNDINCLLKQEYLPFDLWTEISTKKYIKLSPEDARFWQILTNLSQQKEGKKILKIDNANLEQYKQQNTRHLDLVLEAPDVPTIDPNQLESKVKFEKDQPLEFFEEKCLKSEGEIILKGCRENNLKNIDVRLLKNKMNMITGVSGSGKSSLAFDTIYAEGNYSYFANFDELALHQLKKPVIDEVVGLTPTIGLKQNYYNSNSRSTLGTLSRINKSIRELFVLLGITHCPFCGRKLKEKSSLKNTCEACGYDYPTIKNTSFNANTPMGACRTCEGKGELYTVNPDLIIEDKTLSILDGATSWWGKLKNKKRNSNWYLAELYSLADYFKVDLSTPWNHLSQGFIDLLFFGSDGQNYSYTYERNNEPVTLHKPIKGVKKNIEILYQASKNKEDYLKYMEKKVCPSCNGEKICTEARYTTLQGYRFDELLKLPISELFFFFESLEVPLAYKKMTLELTKNIQNKIYYLHKIGLGYLSLSRRITTLSSGEIQRIKIINQVNNNELSNITYIFDEPTSGLHPKDKEGIKKLLKDILARENTLIVVEHDKEMMKIADRIIELGPGAGKEGGEVVASGTREELAKTPNSIIGEYLNTNAPIAVANDEVKKKRQLQLLGCKTNNLKNITVVIPLNTITCITGVSGSGKTSLIFGTLLPALKESIEKKAVKNKTYESLSIEENLERLVFLNHKKIGRSSRSSIVSYIKVFDEIRALFCQTEIAQEKKLNVSYFSANSALGQCSYCKGLGLIKPSGIYANTLITCPQCNGTKYAAEVLTVRYKDRTINEVLDLTVLEALAFFEENEKIHRRLMCLKKVGLSYLKLGDSTSYLSGGESQRLKLSRELARISNKSTIFLLDEPTSGLHYSDVENLLDIFYELREQGHSIIMVEHNVEVIRKVDWIVDLGPGGDSKGGEIVAEGTPKDIYDNVSSSYYQLL